MDFKIYKEMLINAYSMFNKKGVLTGRLLRGYSINLCHLYRESVYCRAEYPRLLLISDTTRNVSIGQ